MADWYRGLGLGWDGLGLGTIGLVASRIRTEQSNGVAFPSPKIRLGCFSGPENLCDRVGTVTVMKSNRIFAKKQKNAVGGLVLITSRPALIRATGRPEVWRFGVSCSYNLIVVRIAKLLRTSAVYQLEDTSVAGILRRFVLCEMW